MDELTIEEKIDKAARILIKPFLNQEYTDGDKNLVSGLVTSIMLQLSAQDPEGKTDPIREAAELVSKRMKELRDE